MSKNWESPISIIEEIGREMAEAYDAYIVGEVRKVVPHIDKEELVKALEYDRGQYEKGYADGRADATRHGHWIKDRLVSTSGGTYGVYRCSKCEWYGQDIGYSFNYCPHCGAIMDEVTDGV